MFVNICGERKSIKYILYKLRVAERKESNTVCYHKIAWNIYLSWNVSSLKFSTPYEYIANIICGIPQGSILGPLLFLLYINDFANFSNALFTILFADDSNLFISGDDHNELVNTKDNGMLKVIEWLRANKLTSNTDKTYFVLFCRQRKLANLKQSLMIMYRHWSSTGKYFNYQWHLSF